MQDVNSVVLLQMYLNQCCRVRSKAAASDSLVCHRCSNAETQIFTLLDKLNIGSASFNATTLASYYILGEGGSVNAIAESATGVNFVGIENTINNTIQNTITVRGWTA